MCDIWMFRNATGTQRAKIPHLATTCANYVQKHVDKERESLERNRIYQVPYKIGKSLSIILSGCDRARYYNIVILHLYALACRTSENSSSLRRLLRGSIDRQTILTQVQLAAQIPPLSIINASAAKSILIRVSVRFIRAIGECRI